jgi:hypothetical protein
MEKTGSAIRATARFPAQFSEHPWGRSLFNFARWNYDKNKAVFGPAIRMIKEAGKTTGSLAKGDTKAAAEAGSKATANALRLLSLGLINAYAMPYADGFVQRHTGDQMKEATRWGSLAIMQAFIDAWHQKNTSWSEAAGDILRGFASASPVGGIGASMFDYMRHARKPHPPERKDRPDTLAEVVKGSISDIPIVSIFQRPWNTHKPWQQNLENEAISQGIGMHNRPRPVVPGSNIGRKMRIQ